MADLQDPSRQPPRKHKVIHWNPVEDDSAKSAKSTVSAYLGGALAALGVVAALAAAYFLFIYQPPAESEEGGTLASASQADPRRAFESVSRAQGVRDNIERQLAAARQMPITGNEALRQMLINIEKEMIDANDLMRDSRYARAIAQYTEVGTLIDDFTLEVNNKQQAQNLYDNFLLKSSELEIGKHLDEDNFDAAFVAASEGKSFLDLGSFSAALQRMNAATQHLAAVENSIDTYVRTNASQGHQFISQGKSAEAVEAFTNVLEIEPSNEEALKQLERARVADQVYAALQTAKSNEDSDNLEQALEEYSRAFSIDPGSAKAQSGVSRVRRKIAERDFNAYSSAAIAAMQGGRYEDAIENYQAALAIFPGRSDIESAIDQARAEKRQNDIVTRITRAYDYEREYNWADARDIYQQLVQIEPDLQEAKDGLLRTGRMIRSILRYQTMLEVAKKEAQAAEFQMAIRTFDEAMKSKPAYLELTEDGERLRNFLQLQSRPVPVQIISDGSTWVSIQGPSMRKPEKFDSMEVDLLPGKYFVIGRKKGHQDVRFGLQIRGGMTQEPITVICNQKSNF